MDEQDTKVFAKDIWKAFGAAVLIMMVGLGILAWQYQRLAKNRVGTLEEQMKRQQELISRMEERDAEDVVRLFLNARVSGNQAEVTQYVTEGAMEDISQGKIRFEGFTAYEILKRERLGENEFRFQAKLLAPIPQPIEIIRVIRMDGRYYIESVDIVG
ncbi:MAG: hypothetical protein HYW95_02975 [Candidatus Wildermuthbacteria bacterium]|nr:hypothetical protein [Candidatus Wildermuthbacteria bacterium]